MGDADVPAPQPIPYATPIQYSGERGVWREGNLFVFTKHTPLPSRCIKCNQPSALNFKWRSTLYWHNPTLYVLALFPGILLYAVIAMVVRKSARVEIPLCEVHRARRRRDILIAWLMTLAAFGCLMMAVTAGMDRDYGRGPIPLLAGIVGFVLLIGSLIWAMIRTRPVKPKKIDDRFVWLSGAGPEFLNSLPPTGR